MSKSMNNPAEITALRKNLSTVQPSRDDDSDNENPIDKRQIEGILNKGDQMKKLKLRQSALPIETHIKRSMKERFTLAKKRAIQNAKNLPKISEKVRMVSRNSHNHSTNSSQQYGSLSQTGSSAPYEYHAQNSKTQLHSVASSQIFPQHDLTAGDLNTNKMHKISSYKSLVEMEIKTRNAGPQIRSMQTIEQQLQTNTLSTPKYGQHPMNKSQISANSRHESLSPQARQTSTEVAQKKQVFRDFSLPVHHGKGSRDKNVAAQKEKVDIISNHVQTTLKQVEQQKIGKQEKLQKYQDDVVKGGLGGVKRAKKDVSVEKDDFFQMPLAVRNKFMTD